MATNWNTTFALIRKAKLVDTSHMITSEEQYIQAPWQGKEN